MIRYLDAKSALPTLRHGILKVSDPDKFNDPFEFCLRMTGLGANVPDDLFRRALRDGRIRVLCTSDEARLKTNGDILMWSHYAAGHTGFRIHIAGSFLAEQCLVYWPIENDRKVPTADLDYTDGNDEAAAESFDGLRAGLGAKGRFWAYEKEVRFFFKTQTCGMKVSRNRSFHFIPLPSSAVDRVDIGLCTDRHHRARMLSVLRQQRYKHVTIFEAIRKEGSFSLQYRKICNET